MSSITISKNIIEQKEGVVVLPIKIYEQLIANVVPTYYLEDLEAIKTDALVEECLEDYRTGKCKIIQSLDDLNGD